MFVSVPPTPVPQHTPWTAGLLCGRMRWRFRGLPFCCGARAGSVSCSGLADVAADARGATGPRLCAVAVLREAMTLKMTFGARGSLPSRTCGPRHPVPARPQVSTSCAWARVACRIFYECSQMPAVPIASAFVRIARALRSQPSLVRPSCDAACCSLRSPTRLGKGRGAGQRAGDGIVAGRRRLAARDCWPLIAGRRLLAAQQRLPTSGRHWLSLGRVVRP